jgi:hypothetical protein
MLWNKLELWIRVVYDKRFQALPISDIRSELAVYADDRYKTTGLSPSTLLFFDDKKLAEFGQRRIEDSYAVLTDVHYEPGLKMWRLDLVPPKEVLRLYYATGKNNPWRKKIRDLQRKDSKYGVRRFV